MVLREWVLCFSLGLLKVVLDESITHYSHYNLNIKTYKTWKYSIVAWLFSSHGNRDTPETDRIFILSDNVANRKRMEIQIDLFYLAFLQLSLK